MVVVSAFILLWWQAAIRRYLHMEHAWAVAASVSAIAIGGSFAAMFWLRGDFVQIVLERLGLVP